MLRDHASSYHSAQASKRKTFAEVHRLAQHRADNVRVFVCRYPRLAHMSDEADYDDQGSGYSSEGDYCSEDGYALLLEDVGELG